MGRERHRHASPLFQPHGASPKSRGLIPRSPTAFIPQATIVCNHVNFIDLMSDSLQCHGKLQGDADIAGRGVILSMWLLTALSVIFSWLLWYSRIIRQRNASSSRSYRMLLKCALMFGDMQLCNALAIICSSIILIRSDNETSLYHVFIARCLTQANFTGHGAALIFDTTMQANWQLRLALLALTLGLYTYWTGLCIREFDLWVNITPSCFFNISSIPFWYTTWMYIDIPWTLISYSWLFAECIRPLEQYLRRLNDATLRLLYHMCNDCRTALSRTLQLRPLIALSFAITALIQVVTFLVLAIIICPPIGAPFASTMFFIWSLYDLETVRYANKHILVLSPTGQFGVSIRGNGNPEDDWGYGQLLPLLLLILPVLQIADIVAEESKHDRVTSAHTLDLAVIQRQRLSLTQRTRITQAL